MKAKVDKITGKMRLLYDEANANIFMMISSKIDKITLAFPELTNIIKQTIVKWWHHEIKDDW